MKYFVSYALDTHPPRFGNEVITQHPLKWQARKNAELTSSGGKKWVDRIVLWWTQLDADDGMEA